MNTIQRIEKYIADNEFFEKEAKIVVGVSGGADSVALLDILCGLGYRCIVAHCNFHLRGEESDRDERFVKELVSHYGLEYASVHFDTEEYAARKSISIEMAARELRYDWFEDIRKQYDAHRIAIAHQMDDSVETVLLNMIRGTGIRGLTGIPPRNGYIVRPLLCVSRHEVLDYLEQKGLRFVEDSTNREDIYTRNKIRLSILPLMEEINPSVRQTISRMASNLKQVECVYLTHIKNSKNRIFAENKISIPLLLKEEEPKAILFELLFPLGFNSATVDNIWSSLQGSSGKMFFSETHRLIKDRNSLIVEEIIDKQDDIRYCLAETDLRLYAPVQLKIENIENNEDFFLEKNASILYLDRDMLKFPLVVRRWRQGDWFVPFGMKGRKKLSDYFTDKKYSLADKENVWLLCNGNNDEVLWIVGDRADNRCRVTDKTRTVLKISLLQ